MAIDVLTAGDGWSVVDAYGEHMVSGHLVLAKTDVPRAYHFWLGAGPWDAAVKIYYRGGEMPTTDYHFHPGVPSGGFSDPVQGIDSFFGAGIPYSETAYLAWQPPEADEDPDPQQVVGRYRTQLVPDYDAAGLPLGYGFSPNPARIMAKLIADGRISPSRIHWPSWAAWRDVCDQHIDWNDGGPTAHAPIRRFEAHVDFTAGVELLSALNLLTDLSATVWQDDGDLIRFKPLLGDFSIYTFTKDNIVRDSISGVYELDVREIPTRQPVHFRNLDSELLEPAEWTGRLSTDDDDQEPVRTAGTAEYGAMYFSQAQRLAKYFLRRVLPKRISFTGLGETFAVQPGDRTTFIHPALGANPVDIMIIEVEEQPDQADTRRFLAGILDGPLYRDEDHEPISKALPVPASPVAA